MVVLEAAQRGAARPPERGACYHAFLCASPPARLYRDARLHRWRASAACWAAPCPTHTHTSAVRTGVACVCSLHPGLRALRGRVCLCIVHRRASGAQAHAVRDCARGGMRCVAALMRPCNASRSRRHAVRRCTRAPMRCVTALVLACGAWLRCGGVLWGRPRLASGVAAPIRLSCCRSPHARERCRWLFVYPYALGSVMYTIGASLLLGVSWYNHPKLAYGPRTHVRERQAPASSVRPARPPVREQRRSSQRKSGLWETGAAA